MRASEHLGHIGRQRMREKPPCKVDGIDCPNRCVGCRSTCQQWLEWTEIHAKETAEIREKRCKDVDANMFLAGRGKRLALDNSRRATENHLKRIEKK